MKTKTLLTYGAIAAGAYLAYRFLNAEIKGKRFANADGTIGGTFTTGSTGTAGMPLKIPEKEYLFQNYSDYPKINLISCYKKLEDRVRNWRLYYTAPMNPKQMEMFFADCLKNSSKKPSIYDKANIGSVIGR
jgi:hypothetical protein